MTKPDDLRAALAEKFVLLASQALSEEVRRAFDVAVDVVTYYGLDDAALSQPAASASLDVGTAAASREGRVPHRNGRARNRRPHRRPSQGTVMTKPDDLRPLTVTLEGPEDDGSWGIAITFRDKPDKLLTGGDTFSAAIANAVESWPDDLSAFSQQSEKP